MGGVRHASAGRRGMPLANRWSKRFGVASKRFEYISKRFDK
jgi:hypothetical protein